MSLNQPLPSTLRSTPPPPAGRSISVPPAVPPPPRARSTKGPDGETTSASNGNHRRAESGPVFPEAHLVVRAWNDPVLDHLGHDPRSPYVERFWLAVVGPSCLFLLRRLAAELERQPDGFVVDSRQWAGDLGLGMKGGRHGPFWRAVERACRFRLAQRNGELLAVRRRIAPLTTRQVGRLPDHLTEAHHIWTAEQRRRDQRKTLTAWSSDRSEAAASPPAA